MSISRKIYVGPFIEILDPSFSIFEFSEKWFKDDRFSSARTEGKLFIVSNRYYQSGNHFHEEGEFELPNLNFCKDFRYLLELLNKENIKFISKVGVLVYFN